MYTNKAYELCNILINNNYPGRGIVVGTLKDGSPMAMYFIMGRSENSRNRVFLQEENNIRIEPYDISKLKDPSLIVYYPVRKIENTLIITNGDQTDTIYDFLSKGKSFEDALQRRFYEPDAPHFTPRISALLNLENGDYSLSILKKQKYDSDLCTRQYFNYKANPGTAHFIHTYEEDGEILTSFYGEPCLLEVSDDFNSFVKNVWDSLNMDNKISLYAYSKQGIIIINRHNKQEAL
ncbi:MAG: inosine monophosphate cyclohydrolase [Christensenellaceae bacterium]|nr:inosine monophosphate cyclohydrolase [Christensenellaceae bacterium]